MDFNYVISQGDMVLILTFSVLVVMSIMTWVTVILKIIRLIKVKIGNKDFIKTFWDSKNLSEALSKAKESSSPFAGITEYSINQVAKYGESKNLRDNISFDQYINRNIYHALDKYNKRLSSGLTLLSSVGATAPFVGLFGTVWGIYHALINISIEKQVELSSIIGLIGEALIATAAGLFVAIPAVWCYNIFVRINKNLNHEFNNYIYDLRILLLNDKGENKGEQK